MRSNEEFSALSDDISQTVDTLKQYVQEKAVSGAAQSDDITMEAFRQIETSSVPEIHFDNAALEDIGAATEFVEQRMEELDCSMRTIMQINVAIDELMSNIIRYGYKGRTGPVSLSFLVKEVPKRIYLRFRDAGVPYNPLAKKDPDITLSAEERQIGGLGIYMVKKTMDDIQYQYEDGQNILTIMKKLK